MNEDDDEEANGTVVHGFDADSKTYKCCCRRIHVKTGTFVMAIFHSFGLLAAFARIVTSTVIVKTSSFAYMPTIVSGFLLSTNLVAVVLMFVGVCRRIPKLLTPLLLNLICTIIVCVICFIFLGVSFAVASFDVAQTISTELSVEHKAERHSLSDDDRRLSTASPMRRNNNLNVSSPTSTTLTPFDNHELSKHDNNKNNTNKVDQGFQIGIGVLVLCFLIVAILNYWIFNVIKSCRTYLTDESNWRRNRLLNRRYKSTDRGDGCVIEEGNDFNEINCTANNCNEIIKTNNSSTPKVPPSSLEKATFV